MNSSQKIKSGVLGKGPAFWAVMVFIATALVITLAATGAVEGPPVLVLMGVPCALALVMFLAGYKSADDPDVNCGGKGAAQKRYIKRTALFTSLYLVTFGVLTFADARGNLADEVKFGLALLPGFAVVGFFWTIGRLIVEESDEFIRMLVVRQTLVAAGFALSLASVWGFLEVAGVVMHIDAYFWAVAFFFGLLLGAIANRIQYGTWGAV